MTTLAGLAREGEREGGVETGLGCVPMFQNNPHKGSGYMARHSQIGSGLTRVVGPTSCQLCDLGQVCSSLSWGFPVYENEDRVQLRGS